jgi:predicted lipid carrier protein YhbT
MSQPGYERSEEQVRQERAATQVSDVLLNLEWTLEAARKGLKVVRKDGVDVNAELALADLIKDLERLRKRFTQDTYYAGDDRLI